MKKYLLILLTCFLVFSKWSYSQINGTYTIGDPLFPSIAFAIDSLNSQPGGIGTSSGVVFNVPAGYSETFTSPLDGTITATGSVGAMIVFQKSGLGVNPRIKAAPGTSTTTDGIIKIAGGDYFIFDGIDLQENDANTDATTQMEWGYALVKGSATAPFNGCQFVVIKNCNITLNRANVNSVGIYTGNHIATATTSLTITAIGDATNNCKFFANAISNVYTGIRLGGYAASSPFSLYDQNNEVGRDSSNYISNYGGGGSTAYGIYAIYQNNLKVAYNVITSAPGTTTTLYGIYTSTGTSSNVDIYSNQVTITGGGTSSTIYGINNAMGATATTNSVNINNNLVYGCTYPTATSGAFYGIVSTGNGAYVNLIGNIVRDNQMVGTGTFYGIDGGGATGTTLTINDNKVYNNTKTSPGTSTATMYCIRASTAIISLNNNEIYSNTATTTGGSSACSLYGYYDLSSPTVETYTNNKIYNLSVTGSSSSTSNICHGIYTNTTSTDIKNWSLNVIHDLSITASGGGTIYGIFTASGATINIFRNKVYALSSSGGTPTVSGIYVSSGTTVNLYNNLIGGLDAPSASAAWPILGINIAGGTTVNAYYNSVYLNAQSTGTNFGSAAVYASTTPNVTLRNNLFANASTPNGTGLTVAYRRSSTTLTTYGSASNNNYFFAGPVTAANVIFYDGTNSYQTLAAYQALVTPRDNVSVSNGVGPTFLSTTGSSANFLHIDGTVPSPLESGAAIISGYDVDYDNSIRYGVGGYIGTGTAPDIGADEYEGLPNYTCGTPVPGNTVSTENPICLGHNITLSLQTTTPGTGLSYQWMSSSDGSGYGNIYGATDPTYSVTPATAMYYMCKVTCQNGPVYAFSSPIHIVFASSITSTTPGSRCGVGTVNLGAVASAGATLGWYATPTGGSTLGTGSPFTTPIISSSTNFYVGAETVSSGPVTIGAGATTSATYSNPFYSLWSNLHSQILVRASDLSLQGLSAGNITAVALDITNAGTLPMIDFSLKIAATTANDMSSFVSPAFTTVYTSASLMPTTGLNTLTFSTPFNWDGISNIVLEFCHGNSASSATMSRTCKADNTSYVSVIKTHKSAATAASVVCPDVTTNLLTYSVRPTLTFTGQTTCSSVRTAVMATVETPPALSISPGKTICSSEVYTLAVSTPLGNFDTYTWEPVTNLFTDAGCTVPYVALSNASTVYYKSLVSNTTQYTCVATKTATNCVNQASCSVTSLPPSVVVTATPEEICVTGSSVLTVSPSSGYGTATFQWQESSDNVSFSDIVGATGLSYTTPVLTSTRYYKFKVFNGDNVLCTETLKTVIVNNPQVTSTTPASRCGIGTVTLGATGTGGTLNWYNVSQGGMALGTGTSFTTPVISATTPYYVGCVSGGGTAGSVGPVDNTIGTGSSVALNYYLYFDVLANEMSLDGVYVYPGAVGDVKLNIYNSSGTVLYTVTQPVTATGVKTYIPIGYNIPNGTGYRIGWATGGVSLYRNTTGSAFPYTLPGVVSITGHNFSGYPQYYYYFYDWQVSTGCSSARTQVVATVIPGPALTITSNQIVCNDAIATLQVTSTLSDYDTYVWSPSTHLYTDPAGTLPYDGISSASTIYCRTTTPGTTTYTCNASKVSTGCVNIALVDVNVLPSDAYITATPSSICISGSTVLSLNPTTGWGSTSFQWQESADNVTFNDINGAVFQSYTTPTLTSVHYYKVQIKNGLGVVCYAPGITVNISNPQVLSSVPGTRCGSGTVQLSATANAGSTLKWYASSSSGTILGTGSPFITPSISAPTTFYVAAEGSGSVNETGGRTDVVTTSGYLTTGWGVLFDVTQDLTLNSTTVYPVGSGTITIGLLNSAGAEIATTSAMPVTGSGASTPNVVPLGFTIPAGTNYKLVMKAYAGITDLLRESSGNTFPYPSPSGAISVTGGWSGSTSSSYYWFYSLNISIGCASARTPVLADVTPAPVITPSATPPSICIGGSATLNVTSQNDPNYSYIWTPGNLSGASQVVSPGITTSYTVSATDASSGCHTTASVVVTVNPLPSAVTVTPPSATTGSIQQLVASGGTVGGELVLGTGTTTNATTGYPSPYSNYYGGTKHQMLVHASELIAAGMTAGPINSISFNVTAVGSTFSGSLSSFQISMKNTASTVLTSTSFETGLTLVYGPLTQAIPTTGLPATVTHVITPFVWDGSSNLLIETSYSNNNAGTATDYVQMRNSDPGFVSTNWYRVDSQTAAYVLAATTPTSSGNARPNMVLSSNIPTAITWSPHTSLFTDAAGTIPYTGEATNTVYANPTEAITYTATATSTSGCISTGSCVFTSNRTLAIKLLLEGLIYDRGAGTPPAGTMFQAYNESGPQWAPGIADHVTIELRNSSTGALVYTISNVNVATDGSLSSFVPAAQSGSYYIYVKHRNSITTSSAVPVSFSGSTVSYDFTTGASQAYGSNMQTIGGYSYIFSGDENQDGLVDSSDLNDCDNDSAGFVAGYVVTDINGDGLVDSSDMNLIDNNNAGFIAAILPF